MIHLRDTKPLAAVLGTVAAAVTMATLADRPTTPDPLVLGKKDKDPVIDASCDVDGVSVSYDAPFRSTPATAGHRVIEASVSDVAPSCAGATVTVRLTSGDDTVATGTAPASGDTVSVPFTASPAAHQVNGVHIEIAGGTTPIPAECKGMLFDQFRSLTLGDDAHAGSNDRDLVYGLEGHDTIRGANQRDCLDGQAGNDGLYGDNHEDVLLGGAGDDTLEGGAHDDLLVGGDGNDILRGGNGRDVCDGGTGSNTLTSCEVNR